MHILAFGNPSICMQQNWFRACRCVAIDEGNKLEGYDEKARQTRVRASVAFKWVSCRSRWLSVRN